MNIFTRFYHSFPAGTGAECLNISLKFILGAIFIASGILKLYPIEPFEYTFVEQGFANWTFAPFIARGIIAAELFLGLLVWLNIYKKFTYLSILVILFIFSGYLAWGIIKNGNEGNCGCFGTILEMTPLESIGKNVILIAMVIFLYKFQVSGKWKIYFPGKWHVWLFFSVGILSMAMPFILNPVEFSSVDGAPVRINEKPDIRLLPKIEEDGVAVNFGNGEKILAFFSVKCAHCKAAAYKLTILKREYNMPPVYVFFLGKEEKVKDFFKASRSKFPYSMFMHTDFFKFSQYKIPVILYVKDGYLIKRWDGKSFNYPEFEIFGRRNAGTGNS